MLLPLVLAAVLSIPSPAGPGSAEPHLAVSHDGALLLSWLEKGALTFSSYAGGKWSPPRTIVQRDDLFVNWADFPAMVADGKGTLFAHWLQKNGKGTYSYDVWITSSSDGGKTWRKPRILHRDGKQAEHGFLSFGALPGGGAGVVWLDGREMTEGHDGHATGTMQLRYTEIDAALKTKGETVIDGRVCECCTTAMTMTPAGPLVAYRDRSNEEIRDISFVRRTKGIWSKPARVHADDWKIDGCPVNGPQLDSRGTQTAVAWFTAVGNAPKVYVAFAQDGAFAKPVRVDGGKNVIGRADVLLLKDGSALVTWVEGDAILARRVSANGRMQAPVQVATTSSARASGFPRAALAGDTPYVAWTDPASKQVRVARVE